MRRTLTGILMAGAAMPISTGVLAQSNDVAFDPNIITVKARRVEENLQDVPIAIAALSPEATIKGYALVNGRISWSNNGGSGITGSLFGRNLLNRKYHAGGNSLGATVGLNTSVPGRPRFWGAEAPIDF